MGTAGRGILRALLFGVLVAATASFARAQEQPAPGHDTNDDDLIASGVSLRKQGRDAEALAAFERAYALHSSARAVAQIALAHQALAHWREAEQNLQVALRSSDDAWIARNRAYLEESLAGVQGHLGWLEAESNVVGAEAWSGGQLLGRIPFPRPVRIAAGDILVEVRAPGHDIIQRELHVNGNETVHAAFVLAPRAVDAAALDAAGIRAGTPAATPDRWKTTGWIAAGSGGALLLAGIAALITREWEAQIYDDDGRCGPLPDETRYQRCGTNRDIGSAAQTVAIVTFSTSAVALAAAGYLLLRPTPPSPRAATSLRCTATGLGLACGGAF